LVLTEIGKLFIGRPFDVILNNFEQICGLRKCLRSIYGTPAEEPYRKETEPYHQ
jgi:hypothetical protein